DQSGNTAAQGLTYTFSTTDRTPPVITSLEVEAPGSVIEGRSINVEAKVAASEGIQQVDFYINGNLAFSTNTSPFVLGLQAVPAYGAPGQSIRVSAYAIDFSGNRSAKPLEKLVPVLPDAPPTATLLAPANGATVASGGVLNIHVKGAD